jgi:hypothetical protein
VQTRASAEKLGEEIIPTEDLRRQWAEFKSQNSEFDAAELQILDSDFWILTSPPLFANRCGVVRMPNAKMDCES